MARRARPATRAPREPRAATRDRSMDLARGSLHPTRRLVRELQYLRHEPGAILPQETPTPEREDRSQETQDQGERPPQDYERRQMEDVPQQQRRGECRQSHEGGGQEGGPVRGQQV